MDVLIVVVWFGVGIDEVVIVWLEVSEFGFENEMLVFGL